MLAALSIAALFLFGLFFLSAMATSLRRLQKRDAKRLFRLPGKFFFYRPFFLLFFPKDEYEGILFSTLVAQNMARFVLLTSWSYWLFLAHFAALNWILAFLLLWIMLLLFLALGDYLPSLLSSRHPTRVLWFSSIICSPFLFVAFPFTFLLMKISKKFWHTLNQDYLNEPHGVVKQEIFEILQEADLTSKLTLHDRQLIRSVVNFQCRIVREVMVPRIDIFSLNSALSIQEASRQLEEQGYSRVPVYKDTIDQIVGILMYKDILTKYREYQRLGNDPKVLEAPIETILKKAVYTPESKKISVLLQEFRKKQVHLAIVVDEYGGTEGLVTIEDILEKIVGDIEDEYDQEEALFTQISDGSWIVDARMSILDAEAEFNVHIPQEGDYDTIGGYLFHRAGSIPSKGFTIKMDDVELEVLKSNDRRVEKVKIKRTQIPPAPEES